MQKWDADRIAFMRDASEYGDYYDRLFSEIQPYLPSEGEICDAGCGLGYLSAKMAEYCERVIAVDSSEETINFLKNRHSIRNLEALCTDLFSLKQDFAAMVFCYFGRTEDILTLSRKLCRGNTVLIKRNCAEHRFSVGEVVQKHAVDDTEAYFRSRNTPFIKKTVSLELGQPFHSLSDAVRFFRIYNKSSEEVTEELILPRLQPLKHPEYKLYLPEKRKMDIFVFCASEL